MTQQSAAARVLVVEDDPALASVIVRALAERGHEVVIETRGDTGLTAAVDGGFDIVVLDVVVPGIDGVEVCRRLRAAGIDATVVMLTARGDVDDRIAGLEAGADDYLTKPFALRELYARIEAVGRRRRPPFGRPGYLQVGSLLLHRDERTCERDGVRIGLRAKEHAVLELLLERAGRVVSRLDILDHAWDEDVDHRSNVIDVQVRRIREKIDEPFGTDSIETVRGLGYRFRKPRADGDGR